MCLSESYPVTASANNISVRVEWLRQSGSAPSEPSETPQWWNTPRPASILWVMMHIALQLPFRRFFLLCRAPMLNKHCGVGTNSDHTSEWVHAGHACVGIAMCVTVIDSARVTSTLNSSSVGGRRDDMILPCHEDPGNLVKYKCHRKLGKIECVFSLYDKLR
jgi:hypothetical protein